MKQLVFEGVLGSVFIRDFTVWNRSEIALTCVLQQRMVCPFLLFVLPLAAQFAFFSTH